MTDEETKAHLLRWCENPTLDPFSWPTDPCGYEQHMKFVNHRNRCWAVNPESGSSMPAFVEFVRAYAESLTK